MRARFALALTLALGLAAPAVGAGAPADGRMAARLEVDSLLVPVVVLNQAGHAVGGLERGDFHLEVDGKAREIEYFEGGDAPFSLAIVIDGSASMIGRRFAAARHAARGLVERLGPRDRVLLVGFDHQARVVTPATGDRQALLDGLDSMATGAGTAVYDALALALAELAGSAGRKALLLLTDGEDVLSEALPGDIERLARRSQVVLYPLWLGRRLARGADARKLEELAEESGGIAFFPEGPDDLAGVYAAVLDEMRKQYTLGFTPVRADGRWHKIGVELAGERLEGLRVRARKGWLAERSP